MQIPLDHFTGNLLFTTDGAWAVYKLKSEVYNFISEEKKIGIWREANTFLQLISECSEEMVMLGKPYSTSVKQNTEILKKTFHGPLKEMAKSYVDGLADYFIELRGDEDNEIITYVLIKLKRKSLLSKGALKEISVLAKDVYFEAVKAFGLTDELPLNQLEEYFEAEKDLLNKIKQYVAKVSEYDSEWLSRTPFVRGLGDPVLRSKKLVNKNGQIQEVPWRPGVESHIRRGEKVIVPRKRDMQTLFDGRIHQDPYKRYLEIESDKGTSYQSFAGISFIDDLPFPGGEWIYYLKTLDFQVEWCIRIKLLDSDKTKTAVRNQKQKVDSQIEHTSKVTDVPDAYYKAEHEGRKIENEVAENGFSFTFSKFILCVSAQDSTVLRSRQEELKQYMKKFDAEIHYPIEDQLDFFYEMLPGSRQLSNNFVHKLPTETIAGYMFNATEQIGDEIGGIIGSTGVLNKPVAVDLRKASQLDKSPSIASIGTLGGGKSLLMKLFALFTVLFGGKALIIDPKRENIPWYLELPWIEPYYETLELDGSDEFMGALDPFMVYDIAGKTGKAKEIAKKEAYQTASSILSYLMGVSADDDMSLAISESCAYARDHEMPCMTRAFEYCDVAHENPENTELVPEFRKLKKHLKHVRAMKISSLLFGDGVTKNTISMNKPITVLQIQGLVLPDQKKDRKDYTKEEIASMGIAISLISIIRNFAFVDRTIFKFIGFDEKWFLERIAEGKQLVEEILRQGRTLNTGIHLIDQNATSYSNEARNLIGLKFVYRTPDEDQAKSALSFLDLEHTKENIELVRNMPDHHVLMKDLNNHVGLVNIELVYEDVLKAFNTRPDLKGGDDDEEIA